MLVLVLAFAMSVPAFAATKGSTYTVTISPGDYTDTSAAGRFKAYEIFTGDLTNPATTDDEKNQLSNIQWGEDINVSALITELTKTGNPFGTAFDGIKDVDASLQASTVAKILDNITHPATVTPETKAAAEAYAKAFAIAAKASLKNVCTVEGTHTHEADKSHPVASEFDTDFTIGLAKSGYYLIVDEYAGNEDGDIISEHILQVVRSREIEVKSDTPSVTKDIVTRNGKGEYEIGEKITFQLVGTLAENFRNFTGDYQYKFIDTMSKGLTLKENSIEVKVYSLKADGSLDAEITTITLTEDETPDDESDDGNYTVSVDDGDDDATVITIAFDNLKEIENLLASYVIVVTYDAYINGDAVIGTPETNTVKVEFSNDPYDEDSTTNTPPDEVEVQTFELDIVKKDSVSGNTLPGVKFKLYKAANAYGKFTGTAGSYTVDTNGAPLTAWTAAKEQGTVLETGTDGKLNIKGLAPGTYYLEEVETPNGYNALPGAIKIEITATYVTADDVKAAALEGKTLVEGDLKTVSATYTINDTTSALAKPGTASSTLGIVTLEVLNVPISSLPSTGGIGNYIFYIGGGLLIVAAIAILIVSKKKATKN